MAERRMFAKKIINSARFLKMPVSSQSLYFHLGMDADDDGIVEAFTTMRMTGASDDDLRVLISKGFIRVLNEDLVTQIMDWKVNNLIKADRYKPSIYQDLMLQIGTDWNPNGTQMEPQVSIGKVSEVKVSKHKYGSYKNVLLTDEELETLKNDFPRDYEERIERVSSYCASTGKTYKNYLATIRNWARKEKPKDTAPKYEEEPWL